MKWDAKRFAIFFVGLLAASPILLFALTGGSFGGGLVCDLRGGKYGLVRSECITRECFKTSACGNWLHPSEWLDRIKPGDDLADVVFWLGEPARIDGETYYWDDGKGSGSHFKVMIRNGRLVSVGPAEPGWSPN